MVRTLDNPDTDPTLMTPPPLPVDGIIPDMSHGPAGPTSSDGKQTMPELECDFTYNIMLNSSIVGIVSGTAILTAAVSDPAEWYVDRILLCVVEEDEYYGAAIDTNADLVPLDEQHFLYALIGLQLGEHRDAYGEQWAEHMLDLDEADTDNARAAASLATTPIPDHADDAFTGPAPAPA
jgi:hypothetical protein